MTERSFSNGNSHSTGNSPTAGSSTAVIPWEMIRGEHWWTR